MDSLKRLKKVFALLLLLLLISTTSSYAYFTANIVGSENNTTISVSGGIMKIDYNGGANISIENIYPRSQVWVTKTFTLSGNNTVNQEMMYAPILVVTNNSFSEEALKYKLIGTNTDNNGKIINHETLKDIASGSNDYILGNGMFEKTDGIKKHTYTLEIYFPDTGENQNIDQGKTFEAHIKIESREYLLATDEDFSGDGSWNYPFRYTGTKEYVKLPAVIKGKPVISTRRMFEEALVKGVYLDNKNITDMSYMFYQAKGDSLDLTSFDTSNVTNMSRMFASYNGEQINITGWNTTKVTNMECIFGDGLTRSYSGGQGISRPNNLKSIVGLEELNMSNVTTLNSMFALSKIEHLNLSKWNTSNVTDMSGMFIKSQASTINFNDFNTSKVTQMPHMFSGSSAKTLDLSSFDTSKVTDMGYMFNENKASKIDLSSFDTTMVTNMNLMFYKSQATILDLSSFDASNVTTMRQTFESSQATSLNLSSFNTSSNLTDMYSTFRNSEATTLDLSSFDTSKVTNMYDLFSQSKAVIINLNSFDTSSVTNMRNMFSSSNVPILDLSFFNTSSVTNMSNMFGRSKVLIFDLSSFDTTNVTDMSSMFNSSIATEAYARTQADADKFNSSSNKPSKLNFTVK